MLRVGGGLDRRLSAEKACALLPRSPGVYRFRDTRSRVLYVGRATDLRSRTRSYWGGLAGRRHLRRMVAQVATVEALVCASVHEACWLERNLLERAKPRWNRSRGGQEVPQWLVVDPGPERPALRLTHVAGADALTFGPYLGGDRSRTALRGILRVWPVHLTGSRVSGSERAMAHARGVSATDRPQLLTDVLLLLSGEPLGLDRATALLTTARDRAAAGLRFETAQRIHDELSAVHWLVSAQRITARLPQDLTVRGWAGGLLVSLSGTATRLDRWEVREIGQVRGQALAAETPPPWRPFAATNAALAATLRQAQRPAG